MVTESGGSLRNYCVQYSHLFWCFWLLKYTCLPNIFTSDIASPFCADTKSIFLHAKSSYYYQFLLVSGNISGRVKRGESTAKGKAPSYQPPIWFNIGCRGWIIWQIFFLHIPGRNRLALAMVDLRNQRTTSYQVSLRNIGLSLILLTNNWCGFQNLVCMDHWF